MTDCGAWTCDCDAGGEPCLSESGANNPVKGTQLLSECVQIIRRQRSDNDARKTDGKDDLQVRRASNSDLNLQRLKKDIVRQRYSYE